MSFALSETPYVPDHPYNAHKPSCLDAAG